MIELPGFLRNYKRTRGPLARSEDKVLGNAAALYDEWWSHDGDELYAASPRGRWVKYQLDWIESHRLFGEW